jgi:hypothetical protein
LDEFNGADLLGLALGGFAAIPVGRVVDILMLEATPPARVASTGKKEREAAENRRLQSLEIQKEALIKLLVEFEPIHVQKLRYLEAAHFALGITHPLALGCKCDRAECGKLVHTQPGSDVVTMRHFEDVFQQDDGIAS